MRAPSNRRGVICGIAACAAMMVGCELDKTGTPRIIPGPSVPSPVPLHAPYIWDTPEELVVWTENAVSRGSFSIDDADSNGAIVNRFMGASGQGGGTLVLRGPDVVPPAPSIRTVRIRYQWLQDGPSSFDLGVSMTIVATNPPSAADLQPRHSQLKAGPGWKEAEFHDSGSAPRDVQYVYFYAYSNGGVLKIDAITLVN